MSKERNGSTDPGLCDEARRGGMVGVGDAEKDRKDSLVGETSVAVDEDEAAKKVETVDETPFDGEYAPASQSARSRMLIILATCQLKNFSPSGLTYLSPPPYIEHSTSSSSTRLRQFRSEH